MILRMNECKSRRPLWLGSNEHQQAGEAVGGQQLIMKCSLLPPACVLSFKTIVFLSKLTLISQTVTHGVLYQGCV